MAADAVATAGVTATHAACGSHSEWSAIKEGVDPANPEELLIGGRSSGS